MKKSVNQTRIGIIGGGQLGRMMILAGKQMGLNFVVLDPHPLCPAAGIADEHIVCGFQDSVGIRNLAEKSDVLTYEFEHINADILIDLEQQGHAIVPSPSILKIIQDKFLQKSFLKKRGIPVPYFEQVSQVTDIPSLASERFGFPFLLKSRYGGYDGKGNTVIANLAEIQNTWSEVPVRPNQLMMEQHISFQLEVSTLVARSVTGELRGFPLSENIHHDNILHTTIVPARISSEVARKAMMCAQKTVEALHGYGVFCVEMFVTNDHHILVNEIAPRTHNSGHYTIEACMTSQFEQHLRGILGLPLGSTDLLKPAVMVNLLGKEGHQGKGKLVGVEELLQIPGVSLHYYGKEETRPGRKMGHITVLGSSVEEAIEKSSLARELVSVVSEQEE